MSPFFIARFKNRLLRLKQKKEAMSPAARLNLHALDHLDLKRPARDYKYSVIDIETTGLDRRTDGIVSIGALKIETGRIRLGQMFHRLVKPSRDISPESVCVHGIRPDMVKDAQPGPFVLEELLAFLGDDILVAHHADFDLEFLNRLMLTCHGFPLQNLTLDTWLLSRQHLTRQQYPTLRRQLKLLGPGVPELPRVNRNFDLDTVTNRFGIPVYHRHTALGDALAAGMIFQQIMGNFEESGTPSLRPLVRYGRI